MSQRQEFLRRIGGPHSVTWFAFWVTFALNALHRLSGGPWVTGSWGLRLFAIIASQLAMFGLLLVARATVLRHAGPVTAIVTFMAAGATRSIVLMAVLATQMDLPAFVVVGSLITGPLMFGAYLTLCNYLVDVYSENKQRLAEAEQAQASLVAARSQAEQVLTEQRRETVEAVETELLTAFDTMAASASTVDSQRLQGFLDDVVRPTSHRLAAGTDRWQPAPAQPVDARLRWGRLFDAVGLSRPFAPNVQATLSIVPALSIVMAVSPARFVLVLAVSILSPWLVLSLGNSLLARLPDTTSAPVRTLAVVSWACVSAVFVAASWGTSLLGTPLAKSGVIYGIFVTLALALSSVAANAALTAQKHLERDLRSAQVQLRWDVARVHQLQWHQQRLSARALHGPVQTAIIREVRRRQSSRDVDLSALREDIHAAMQPESSVQTMGDYLHDLSTSWGPLCTVRYDVRPAAGLNADACARSCLADILREMVGNAVRHGYAKNVVIRISVVAPRVLEVVVNDDGTAGVGTTGAGLGSQMLDDCCLDWQRTFDSTGVSVLFTLPFDPLVRAVPVSSPVSA